MNLELHHFAHKITPNSLEIVLDLFELLGCPLSYREKDARWAMAEYKPKGIDIQLIETDEKPLQTKDKINTHICFLSDNVKDDLKTIETWLESKNIKTIKGDWSDKEYWFDLPDHFTNFVIEIMDTSIIK